MARHNVRDAVFDAGMRMFIARGFAACGVKDVTDEAGVPKGSFYNHFNSKEALAAEIVVAYGEGATDRRILTNTAIPALARLKKHFAALNKHFVQCNDGCLVGRFMAEVSDETPLIRDSLVCVLNLWGKELSAAIAAGQKEGSIQSDLPADELAAFLIDAYEGAILRTRVEQTPRALKTFVRIVFSSIAA